eukprot:CAMPEP_0195521484 /NCGR_PEP_ID=MMETSP0794_2-20130614/18787_1 /TAXON_ID=515487 /ORGANISM="Stephanopyxis turris, Strain CCMP 815" /LENGTH=83 /DNA_ID=CAMNT_0040651055 /DNA_START=207 /DNA_END=457 /DNA_ORIENTATION=-
MGFSERYTGRPAESFLCSAHQSVHEKPCDPSTEHRAAVCMFMHAAALLAVSDRAGIEGLLTTAVATKRCFVVSSADGAHREKE